jgi:hypothetical protein
MASYEITLNSEQLSGLLTDDKVWSAINAPQRY